MNLNKIYDIDNNQVVIQLPESFQGKKKVLITISEIDESKQQKMELMKLAFKDRLFLNDLNEVNNDFANIENENWQ